MLQPLREATDRLQADGVRALLSIYLPTLHRTIDATDEGKVVYIVCGDGEHEDAVEHADLHPLAQQTRKALHKELIDVLDKHDEEEKQALAFSTFLDPRLKNIEWMKAADHDRLLAAFKTAFEAFAVERRANPAEAAPKAKAVAKPAAPAQADLLAGEEAEEPPAKRRKKGSAVLFDSAAPASPPRERRSRPHGSRAEILKDCNADFRKYQKVPVLKYSEDPLAWWRSKVQAGEYGELGEFAKMYLATPSSSAAVERLFSICGRMFHGR